jgi:4-oxalocrotonate tautomerase
MPLVHTYVWEGLDDDRAKQIILGITKVFTDLGIPAEAVRVIIQEVPKSRWGIAGELASERKPRHQDK